MERKRPRSRRERAKREAAVGAVVGACSGFGFGHWLSGGFTGETVCWAVIGAVFCAVVFHHGEWMCG